MSSTWRTTEVCCWEYLLGDELVKNGSNFYQFFVRYIWSFGLRISIRNVVLIINFIVVCLYSKQPPDASPVIFSLSALIHFDATWITYSKQSHWHMLAFDAPSLDSGEEKNARITCWKGPTLAVTYPGVRMDHESTEDFIQGRVILKVCI